MNCILLPFLTFGPFRPVLVFLLGVNQPLWASVQIFISFGVISLDLVSKRSYLGSILRLSPAPAPLPTQLGNTRGGNFAQQRKVWSEFRLQKGMGMGEG